jgi:hypothetical protein
MFAGACYGLGMSNATTATKATVKASTLADVAKAFGCSEKAAKGRLVALGYVETCGRCCGTGRYSYNQMDGDKCYGCMGCGRRIVRITGKLVTEALARIAAGELDGYFATCKRNAEARAMLAPLTETITATWKNSIISRSYSAASREEGAPPLLTRRSYGWHEELNGVGWIGQDWDSGLFLAQSLINSLWDAAMDIEHAMKRGKIVDPVAARDELTWILDALNSVIAYVTPERIRGWGFEAIEAAA